MKEMDLASSADANKENKPSWQPGKGGWPDVEIRLPHGMRPGHQVSLALCPGRTSQQQSPTSVGWLA